MFKFATEAEKQNFWDEMGQDEVNRQKSEPTKPVSTIPQKDWEAFWENR